MLYPDNDEMTQQAIRGALEQYGYYFETLEPDDDSREDQLDRLGRAAGRELGVEVSMAVKSRRHDAKRQVCIAVVRSPIEPP